MYFDLKDERSLLSCAFFKGANQGIAFRPETGMKVMAGGVLTLYEARGQFQLSVRTLEPLGVGALQVAFEQLKKKLQAEGLFEDARKKSIPRYPRRVALVTSPSGAAIQDFMKTLATRVGIEQVDLFAVKVQGEGAPGEIVAAIEEASRRGEHDVLVVTRGGGSLEDLATFNDEDVVRALADCSIPTISAVGHEIDFTLSDFVADRREPTPTAAAAHLAPGIDEFREQLAYYEHRMGEALENLLEGKRRDLKEALRALRDRRPDLLLDQARQDLDYRTADLREALAGLLKDNQLKVQRLSDFLSRTTPLTLVKPLRERLKGLEAQLAAYHPLGPLKRGYAIVSEKTSGRILRDAKEVAKGDRLRVRLKDGELESEVISSSREND
jgi:exodeoxyribonuclease VII large subunit